MTLSGTMARKHHSRDDWLAGPQIAKGARAGAHLQFLGAPGPCEAESIGGSPTVYRLMFSAVGQWLERRLRITGKS